MFEYGCDDAEEHRFLGLDQLGKIYDESMYEEECKLVKTCFAMERRGIKTDHTYSRRGIEHEQVILREQIKQAEEVAGEEYRNGPKWLRAAFDRVGQPYRLNGKTGNPVFDKEALDAMKYIRNYMDRN